MITRSLAAACATLFAFVPAAVAQDVVPLAGKGENFQPIARVKVPRVNEVEMAGDWAFLSQDQGEDVGADGEGGLVIVNVANPEKPFVEGQWHAEQAGIEDAAYGDVDVSPDGNLAVLTNAHCLSCKEGEVAWAVLIDTTDKAHPKFLGKIVDDATMDYVHTATLDNKTLYLNPQVAAFYPQPGNAHITVFDISDPTHPVKKGVVAPPGADLGLAHDSYIDHRPDGKTLMYAASVHKSDVIDVSDPLKSTWLQTATSTYTISHDVQPNHDRSVIIVDDEGAAGGQLTERVSACGKAGAGPVSVDSGSVHFYAADPDGTFANGGAVHLGSFNAPTNANTGACVAHVFWQAPNENRLTQAYYRTGAFAIDFNDPADPKMLGWFLADGGAEYWSNKPHRGYMFASDMEHGLDILRYTGEGGAKWPTTSGPAEIQRSARQGVPYVPITRPGATPGAAPTPITGPLPAPSGKAASSRSLGRFSFTARVKRVPGKSGRRTKLTFTLSRISGKKAGSVSVRRVARRKTSVKVSGVAVTGRYRWTLKAGRKVLARGKFTAKRANGLSLSPGATLAARAR
jgi:LVIVD repeat